MVYIHICIVYTHLIQIYATQLNNCLSILYNNPATKKQPHIHSSVRFYGLYSPNIRHPHHHNHTTPPILTNHRHSNQNSHAHCSYTPLFRIIDLNTLFSSYTAHYFQTPNRFEPPKQYRREHEKRREKKTQKPQAPKMRERMQTCTQNESHKMLRCRNGRRLIELLHNVKKK